MRFFSRIGFNQEKRSALLRYGYRTAIHKWIINWGYSPLMISLVIMWMSLIRPPASLKWFRAAAEKASLRPNLLGVFIRGEGDEWGIKPDIQEAQNGMGRRLNRVTAMHRLR